MRRALSLIIAAAALALPPSAIAGATHVDSHLGDKIIAAPGTINDITVVYVPFGNGWGNAITDAAGVTTPPEDKDCGPTAERTVLCLDPSSGTLSAGQTGLGQPTDAFLRDGNDAFNAINGQGDFSVSGGPGRDRLSAPQQTVIVPPFEGEPGDQFCNESELLGGPGNDRLTGGCGNDGIKGGGGNDRIDARDTTAIGKQSVDLVGCGAGKDVASVDQKDRVAHDCEKVKVH